MAAEILSDSGIEVHVFDAMPSAGRKFLLAGVGGLNLTHSEGQEDFLARYGARRLEVASWLSSFDASAIRAWAQALGIDTFVGSSGRVFPTQMKAAPLLRSWLTRLRANGVHLHQRHRLTGHCDGIWQFDAPSGHVHMKADAVVLAMGGASWPRLGSDGSWTGWLRAAGANLSAWQPANCGFEVSWSSLFKERFAGAPLKNISAWREGPALRGECVISETGVEGGIVYALSAGLRDELLAHARATLHIDLLPDWSFARVVEAVTHPRGARSWSSHLQSRLKLTGVKAALLRECSPKGAYADPIMLAHAIKDLSVPLLRARPIEQAISVAGGVTFSSLNDDLSLRAMPGVFCAGEMIDWEAPTGGYLLSACLASGRHAGKGALSWLQKEEARLRGESGTCEQ